MQRDILRILSAVAIFAVTKIGIAQAAMSGAPSVGMAAPEVIFRPLPSQIASVTPQKGATYNWSIIGGSIVGPPDRSLITFTADRNASVVSLKATVTSPSGVQTASTDIPVVQPAHILRDGQQQGSGRRAYPLLQMLRGERLTVQATPAIPLVLYDIQGRKVASGSGTLDARLPIRGSYFLVADSEGSYQLQVQGARPLFTRERPDADTSRSVGGANGEAQSGALGKAILETSGAATGEALIRSGDGMSAAWFDMSVGASVISHFDAVGREEWTWRSESANSFYVRSLAARPDGGVVGVGSCGNAGPSDEVCIVSVSSKGVLQWLSRLSTSDYDFGYGAAATADRVYVSGFTQGAFPGAQNAGKTDNFVAALDRDGKVLWVKQFGTAEEDRAFAMSATDQGVVVFGDTRGPLGTLDSSVGPGGEFDLFLANFSQDGVAGPIAQFGSDQPDLAFDMRMGATGNLYLTGMTRGTIASGVPSPPAPQVFLIEVKATGQIGWRRQLGPREGQSGETLDLFNDRLAVLFYTNGSFPPGSNNSFGTRGSDDMVIAEYKLDGTLRKIRQFYDTSERIFARGITQTGSGIFVLRDRVYRPGLPFSTLSIDEVVP